jgi:hypothetical protein
MTSALLIKLVSSFVLGALAASTLSVTTERFGSKIAGALGSFPASVAISLYFLGLVNGIDEAMKATTIVPMMMGIYGVTLLLYSFLIAKGLTRALVPSLGLWLALTFAAIQMSGASYPLSWITFLIFLLGCYFASERFLRVPSTQGKKVPLRFSQMLLRMFCGGTVVLASVLVGTFGGPTLGGVMTTFPGVTIATLVVVYFSVGEKVSAAVAKSMMLGGMVNVTLYALAVRYAYPWAGLNGGTLIAFLVACAGGYLTYAFMARRTA